MHTDKHGFARCFGRSRWKTATIVALVLIQGCSPQRESERIKHPNVLFIEKVGGNPRVLSGGVQRLTERMAKRKRNVCHGVDTPAS